MSVNKTPYQDQKYIHVVQFLRPKNFDNIEIVYVRDDKTIVADPLDARWFDTYGAAVNYRTYLQEYKVLEKFSPSEITAVTFAVHATQLGQQPTLKSKDWNPIMENEDDMEKTVITGKAIPDITDQTLDSVEYAVSVGGGLRKFVSDTTYDKVTFRLDEAARYKCFSDALDQAEELRNRQLLDIQIHEIKTEVKVGRTVTL